MTSSPPAAAPTTQSPPAPSPPQSPAKLTAACPFLDAPELAELLGMAPDTVSATEAAPETSSGGIQLECDYHQGGRNPYALTVSGFPAGTLSVADLVDAIPNDAQNVHTLSGIGQAAISYSTADGFTLLCAGTLSHGQSRAATITAPKTLSQAALIEIVKRVVSRL
ncbi:MAG TPA: hypothetical protein VFU65_02090 [Actinocrinis sp.]|nr:hypothetical protein [Actinocrinis sp.]